MGDFRTGGPKGKNDFERLLAERFPSVAAQIDESERDLLHLEMAVLARVTCRAIDFAEFEEVQLHLGFVDELLSNAAPDLENAIYVSYLENVFLGLEDRRYLTARGMLSGRMQTALAELEDHWGKVAKWTKQRQDSPS